MTSSVMNPKTDPMRALDDTFRRASNEGQALADAMTLATVTADGRPAARTVLYKGQDDVGIRFYTNYESEKAREIAANPLAALVFFWASLLIQVRVEGALSKLDDAINDAYFKTRPRESQLGAWASPQSEIIEDRSVIDRRYKEFEERFSGQEIPRPPHWGGYVLAPTRMEFWFSRLGRMHDRYRYDRDGAGWRMSLIAP